ncbi:hypothetical protein [Stenotrophomonas sp. PFBMAA-4]|uniref:bestrophin-like domain n=1 Tax=Stenotrophomonas sp. PFBMAA-4 TaxID=3043301 RepID=UPI0024B4FF78|nr:hypothetical protein [Stenotrophomonas sp. PFBMAA-4]MDI9271823.1 hypothetical protein [Stenotrophomonas sp. PFBMAA-4]
MHLLSSNYPFLPLWLLTILLFLALLAARELGAFVGMRLRTTGETDDDAFAMTTVLGLLALLIGFTFSIALQRYDARRALVVEEANAIGTTWLRLALLPAEDQPRLRGLLRDYTQARVDFGHAKSSEEEQVLHVRSQRLQAVVWQEMVGATSDFKDTARASLLLTTTNQAIDLSEERLASRQAHVPARILWMLVLFAVLASGLVGYERPRHRRTSALVLALFTLAAALVVDLDRPTTGITNVPQVAMQSLLDSMQTNAQ